MMKRGRALGAGLLLCGWVASLACGSKHHGGGDVEGGQAAGGTPAGDGPHGSGETHSATIGPDGGSLTLRAATLTIPPGALSQATTLSITEMVVPAPAGYSTYSPVFALEPANGPLGKPVTLSLPYQGNRNLAAAFLSRADATGYERLGGVPAANTLTVTLSRLGNVFVADGVSYVDPPDRSCTRTRLRGSALNAISPYAGILPSSSLSLLFTAEDCQGRPLASLAPEDFVLKENGTPLSVEASRTIIPANGLQVFVTLMLDMSRSTDAARPQVIAAAKDFVNGLRIKHPDVAAHISISLFDGGADVTELQSYTLDADTLVAKLDTLTSFKAPDPSSTNLYGAIYLGMTATARAERANITENFGGAFTSGYTVLFTDGNDTAGRRSLQDTLRFVTTRLPDGNPDQDPLTSAALANGQLVIVSLASSADDTPTADGAIASLTDQGKGLLVADDPSTLTRDFGTIAERIAGQSKRTYLLGYCSPKRGGSNDVSVEIAGSDTKEAATLKFEATGFAPGCDTTTFDHLCDHLECGGFGCGACDDRTSVCNGDRCVNFCELNVDACSTSAFTNENGYTQSCAADANDCGSVCVDLASDAANCGACGRRCAGTCSLGHCVETLATLPQPAFGFSMSTSNLYWGVQSTDATSGVATVDIMALPKTGGTPTVLATVQDTRAIDAEDLGLYYITSNQIIALSLEGEQTPLAQVAVGDLPVSRPVFAKDADNLYWLAYSMAGSQYRVMTVPRSGGTPLSLFAGVSNVVQGAPLFVRDGSLYWLESSPSVGGVSRILRLPTSGGTVSALISVPQTPTDGLRTLLGVVGSDIYWYENKDTAGNRGSVSRAPLGGVAPGAAPALVANNVKNPSHALHTQTSGETVAAKEWFSGSAYSYLASGADGGIVALEQPSGGADPAPQYLVNLTEQGAQRFHRNDVVQAGAVLVQGIDAHYAYGYTRDSQALVRVER